MSSYSIEHLPYDKNPSEHLWSANHIFKGRDILICPVCESGYVDPCPADTELDDFYRQLYNEFPVAEQMRKPTPGDIHLPEFNARFLSQALFLKSHIPLTDGMRILEIGSSESGILPAFSLFCRPEYFYFDQVESATIRSYGGKRVGNYGTPEEIRAAFEGKPVDLIFMSHSLEHISPARLGEVLGAIYAAIKPGGYFFIEVPNEISRKEKKMAPHTIFFSRGGLIKLFEEQGFEIADFSSFAPLASQTGPNSQAGPAPAAEPAASIPAWKKAVFRTLLSFPITKKLLTRFMFAASVRSLTTPYEIYPYFRVIGRKPTV